MHAVVNCFQIFIFVSSDTTPKQPKANATPLWIAFKFLSLCRQTQRTNIICRHRSSCELLSNFYLCVVRHNKERKIWNWLLVVNCFQIFIFVSSDTTIKRTQPLYSSCELLSNFYLCVVRHNIILWYKTNKNVVNCFQIFIFVSSDTTGLRILTLIKRLWIAFKFLSLCRQTQPKNPVG